MRQRLVGLLRSMKGVSPVFQKFSRKSLPSSNHQLHLALEAAGIGIWRWEAGTGTNELQWDARCKALFGLPANANATYENWAKSILEEHRHRAEAALARALDPAESDDDFICTYPVAKAGGDVRWLAATGRAFFEPAASSRYGRRATVITGTIRDVSIKYEAAQARLLAERALRESEERLRMANEAAGIGTFTADLRKGEAHFSPQLAGLFGFPGIESMSLEAVLKRVLKDGRVEILKKVASALRGSEGGYAKADFRYVLPSGEVRWMTGIGRADSIETAQGRKPHRVFGACLDITERKQQEEQIGLLVRELDHRAKNMLTLVQAIAQQTAKGFPGHEEFLRRFGQRIGALAAAQDLIRQRGLKGIDLHELVRSQLAHLQELLGDRITVKGPPIAISSEATQAIGMAIHELATNAGKYGALSGPSGQVRIAWDVEGAGGGDRRFSMSWRESGGPAVTPPASKGFGSMVISRIVEQSLKAEVETGYAPEGFSWSMAAPAQTVQEE